MISAGLLTGKSTSWFSDKNRKRLLGEGVFGKVYLYAPDFVVKLQSKHGAEICKHILDEITILRLLSHKNIVSLLDVFTILGNDSSDIAMVLTPATMDLHQALLENVDLNKKDILYQVGMAIAYLHSNGVLHGDLKPQNILLCQSSDSNEFQVKLADFGLARTSDHFYHYPYIAHTIWYRAIELLFKAPYTPAADVWAFGCIFHEVLSYRAPFRSVAVGTLIDEILKLFGTPPPEEWDLTTLPGYGANSTVYPIKDKRTLFLSIPREARDLLLGTLTLNPEKRPSMRTILQDPFWGRSEEIPRIPTPYTLLRQFCPRIPSCKFTILSEHIFLLNPVIKRHKKLQLHPRVLALTLALWQQNTLLSLSHELQLIATSVLAIEMVNDKVAAPSFILMFKDKYTSNEIIDMEMSILINMKFECYITTAYDFLRLLMMEYDKELQQIALDFLLISYYSFAAYVGTPENIAKSCLILAGSYRKTPVQMEESRDMKIIFLCIADALKAITQVTSRWDFIIDNTPVLNNLLQSHNTI